ncbi:MAG: trypsin-like peptidase domain-containing protein [Thermodesulfovibrionales bacterium]|nr:trypsin-like peptidase domain-containing protein [Thermodesulfovibrionales bacterium]
MAHLFRVMFFLLIAFLITSFPQKALSQEVVEVPSIQRTDNSLFSTEAEVSLKKHLTAAKLNTTIPPSDTERISLGPMDYKKAKEKGLIGDTKEKALQVGIDRVVEGFDKSKWRVFKAEDGRYNWRMVIHSQGASFIRPRLANLCNCEGEIYFYGIKGGESVEGPFNKEMLSKTGFWGPIIEGEYLFIEVIQYSDRVPPSFTIDSINHGFRDLQSGRISDFFLLKSNLLKESWCYKDVNCYSEWANKKTAVSRYSYQKNGSSWICTGTMINDTASSYRNWFLTANHCVDSNAVANTVVAAFRYWTDTCNGTPPSLASLPKVYGASFKAGASADTGTDFSLLELNSNPPSGTYYLGWTTADVSSGSAVTGLHHPDGSYQRISFGNISGSNTNYWKVRWNTSSTEGGSSGSALFNSNGQIIGQLYGGDASCNDMAENDYYGKFGVSWNLGLKDYLSSTSPTGRVPVYRFFNTQAGGHFFTISEAEKDYVRNTFPHFNYEGTGFYAYSSSQSGLTPVYRFFNTRAGGHFFTISEAERDYVRNNYPFFNYEGIGFYARSQSQSGAVPVYRFFNTRAGGHFFTISETERDYVRNNYPFFNYEGIGFYAHSSQ